jgi:hypothetical protein
MCPLPHSVDHTGDGRNEEAKSPFTLSQPIYALTEAPELVDICPRDRHPVPTARWPLEWAQDRSGRSYPPR